MNSMMHLLDIPVIANKSGRNMLHARRPIIEPAQTITRIVFSGWHILYKIMNPTMARSMVAAVEMSLAPTPKVCPNTTSAPTASTSVSPAGSAFKNTLVRKCPLMTSSFGCSARKNAGMPIVNMLISDICEGSSG